MGLTFDEEKHQYFWNGKRVPGVNEILKKVGLLKDYTGLDPFYAERGKAVHKAIDLHLKGVLDDTSIDEHCRPYLDAFYKFKNQEKFEPYKNEYRCYSDLSNFAGTIDGIWKCGPGIAIIDYKCTENIQRESELQLCAYQILANDTDISANLKFILQLKKDSTYELHDFSHLKDYLWLSVLDLYEWKTKKNEKT